jgi:hypothetical protein
LIKVRSFAFSVFFFLSTAYAGHPPNEIQNAMGEHLSKLQSASAWREFVKSKPDGFPKDLSRPTVLVDKMPLQLKDEAFTLGISYRQMYMKTTMERAKQIMTSPDLWRSLFGLDADSKLEETGNRFKARIFKKVPVISDQDYVLEYKNLEDQGIWFQRATQAEDKKEFALRDNLKALEQADGGIILREVSIVYILRWYLRALGPQVRSVMVKELTKLNSSTKCAAESEKPMSQELAKECFTLSEKSN